ncbi:MAG TPA: hypothetical protein VFS40_06200 [Gemmatimonadales bacterium]|nr:hypothetical protein [Gemmatimonadales bacterium]
MRSRPMVLALALTCALAPLGGPLGGPLAAQQRTAPRDVRRVERRLAVAPDVALRIFNLAGTTRVTGWERDSVVVTAALPRGAGELVAGGTRSAVKIGIDAPGAPLDAPGAALEVRVPRGALVWIKGAAGAVDVEDVTGALDVYTVSGDVTVRGAPAQLGAESMSGDLVVEATAPSMRLKTAGGAITLTGGAESLTIATVSGPVRVRTGPLLRGEIQSVSGAVDVDGAVRAGGELALLTHAAPITLTLPGSTRAELELRTFDGLLINRFSPEPARVSRGKPYRFAIGGGAPGPGADDRARITVRTLKGDIAIYRGPGGS